MLDSIQWTEAGYFALSQLVLLGGFLSHPLVSTAAYKIITQWLNINYNCLVIGSDILLINSYMKRNLFLLVCVSATGLVTLPILLYILLLRRLTGISLDPTLIHLFVCLDFPRGYILPCHRSKQIYSSTNKSNKNSQCTEGYSSSMNTVTDFTYSFFCFVPLCQEYRFLKFLYYLKYFILWKSYEIHQFYFSKNYAHILWRPSLAVSNFYHWVSIHFNLE